ncbi:hypothetical protein GCM10007977_001400 [Dactylosporangium sucinum]|uniref:Uncharacterized protein n=1 Tax=Dactylosporangium sucinum TaxID=1424081 RepID=A0A917SZE8_9ACTN|nr:hypothetical protein GCM10007977_001400 [Dactylosporangium sucinum]
MVGAAITVGPSTGAGPVAGSVVAGGAAAEAGDEGGTPVSSLGPAGRAASGCGALGSAIDANRFFQFVNGIALGIRRPKTLFPCSTGPSARPPDRNPPMIPRGPSEPMSWSAMTSGNASINDSLIIVAISVLPPGRRRVQPSPHPIAPPSAPSPPMNRVDSLSQLRRCPISSSISCASPSMPARNAKPKTIDSSNRTNNWMASCWKVFVTAAAAGALAPIVHTVVNSSFNRVANRMAAMIRMTSFVCSTFSATSSSAAATSSTLLRRAGSVDPAPSTSCSRYEMADSTPGPRPEARNSVMAACTSPTRSPRSAPSPRQAAANERSRSSSTSGQSSPTVR